MPNPTEKRERNREIFLKWKAGVGPVDLEREYNLGKWRIRNIIVTERLAEYHGKREENPSGGSEIVPR